MPGSLPAFLARRGAGLALTLLVISVLVFAATNLLPGDPAAVLLGTAAREDTLAALRAELGLDRPLPLRYAAWIGGLLTGDLGRSLTYGVPVAGLIADRMTVTLPLAVLALLLAAVLALPLGVLAAERRNGAADAVATLLAQGGVALPNFWIGLLLILLFSSTLRIMPAGGFPGWRAGVLPALQALFLPAVALALPQAAVLARVTRAAVLDQLGEPYLRTAQAKGLTRGQAIRRHAVPNALIPVVTILGLQFSFLVAGAVLVENVFALPGLGTLALQALAQRDFPVLGDVVLVLAATVIVVNALVDLSYGVIDPRLRDRG